MNIDEYSSEQLESELRRRKADAERRQKEAIARRTVRVVCPRCNGVGTVTVRDHASGYDCPRECDLCHGGCVIDALKV